MSGAFHIALLQKVSISIHTNLVPGTILSYLFVRVLKNNLANKLLVLESEEKILLLSSKSCSSYESIISLSTLVFADISSGF